MIAKVTIQENTTFKIFYFTFGYKEGVGCEKYCNSHRSKRKSVAYWECWLKNSCMSFVDLACWCTRPANAMLGFSYRAIHPCYMWMKLPGLYMCCVTFLWFSNKAFNWYAVTNEHEVPEEMEQNFPLSTKMSFKHIDYQGSNSWINQGQRLQV